MYRSIAVVFLFIFAGSILAGCGNKDASSAESFIASVDDGRTFEPRMNAGEKSIAGISVLSMAQSVQNPKTIYIGSQKNGIFVTHDGGEQWQSIVFPPQKVYGIVVDAHNESIIYASGIFEGFARIYKTEDAGENWDEVYTEPTKSAVITAMVADPAQPRTLYVGMSTGVIIKTTDGGESWANIHRARGPVTQIVFDVADTQTVYFGIRERGLLKTRNGGVDIIDFTKNVAGSNANATSPVARSTRRSTRVYSLVTDPRQSGVVYVGTDRGIYRSSDYGTTWTELDIIESSEKLPVRVIAINPHNTQELVYSVARTLYRSSKNMTEWTPVQISSSRVASVIQYDAVDEGVIYIGLMSGKK